MVGISLGFYLLETFVISTATTNNYVLRIAISLHSQTPYLTLTLIDSLAFAAVIVLLIAAVFAGRNPRPRVYN